MLLEGVAWLEFFQTHMPQIGEFTLENRSVQARRDKTHPADCELRKADDDDSSEEETAEIRCL